MSIKTRLTSPWNYEVRDLVWGSPSGWDRVPVAGALGAQYVSSEGHPYRNIGKGGDVGGPFISQKCEVTVSHPEPLWLDDGGRYTKYSRVYPSQGAKDFEQAWSGLTSSDSIVSKVGSQCPALISGFDLDAAGATAINRVKPTNPVVDGAATIAELIGERKIFAIPGRSGGVSGEYLNYQLGISPALGAIRDFQEAAKNSEMLIEQLHRDSGKNVRRRYEFPPDPVEVSDSYSYGVFPHMDTAVNTYLVGTGTLHSRSWISTKMWFSGAFTYFLPEDVGFARSASELDYLYGIKPGIDTAWEVVPFSFVADYFSNAGDVLSNVNAFAQDGLVLRYGYVMAETVHERTDTWTGPLRFGDQDWRTVEVVSRRSFVNKQRKAATPFGFGVLNEDINPRQLSILAALGISLAR